MIYFNNTNLLRSVNYYVQQLFAQNQGDVYLAGELNTTNLIVSVVQQQKTGELL